MTPDDLSLLNRFAVNADQSAFAELVERHGPLVWGVCRRAVNSEQLAEEAFQAVFVILSRQSATLTLRTSLANWLFGVAARVAKRALRRELRLKNREQVATKQAADDAQQELTELATSVEHEYSLKAETVVEVSPAAAQAILDTARQRDVGLIAMTTHGRGASRLIVGSVTDKVLRGSHVPMLLHRPGRVKAAANPAALAAGGAIRRMAGLTEDDLTP